MSRHSIPAWVRFSLGLVIGSTIALNAWAGDTNITVLDGNTTVTGSSSTTLIFPVTRSGDLSYDAYLSYKTQDGTALSSKDYTGANGVLRIPAGVSNADLRIQVAGATQNDPDKTFSLNVLGAATLPPAIDFAKPQAFTTGNDTRVVVAADLNGDGKPDLVVVNSGDHTLSLLINTTPTGASVPSYAPQQTLATGNYPRGVAVADVNGDGLPDIAETNYTDGTVSVYLNTTAVGASTASFTAPQSFAVAGDPVGIVSADINGDGKPDFVISTFSNQATVLLNQTATDAATASFAPQQNFATGSISFNLTTADINGDGKPDVIVTNANDNTVSVLVNTTPTVTVEPSAVTGTIHYEINTPVVMLNPTNVTLGYIPLGQGSGAYPVDFFNDGTGNITNIAISVTGANAGDFAQSNNCPASLAPSARCTIYVSFRPQATGARSATLSVASNAASSPDSVSLSGTGIGAAATANNGSVSTRVDQAVSGTLSATLGYTGQTLTFQVVGNPGYGTVSITDASSGAFTYTPANGRVGTDSFRFYAIDANGTVSNTATETVAVTDVAATANAGSVNTSPDTAVSGTLSATAAYSGQTLSYAVVTNPGHGTVSLTAGTGAFTYTPANGYAGADSFTFKVTDGAGTASNVATEGVTLTDVAATANGSSLTTGAGQAASGTLSATTAYGGQTLTYSLVSVPANGTASITNASTGTYTYTPGSGFAGSDSFTFKVTDAAGTASNIAAVGITVDDRGATASNGSVSTTPDTAVNGTVMAANTYPGQTFTYSIVTQPTHGGAVIINNMTGSFTYTPATGYTGADSFTFKATDAYGTDSNVGTESVTVSDLAPIATGGNVSTTADVAVSNTLPGGARYAGQTLTFSIIANAGHGTATVTNAATGAFTYTPATGFAGSDTFTFQVADQWGTASTATETATVNDVAPSITGTTSVSMKRNTVHNGTFSSVPKYSGQVLSFSGAASHGSVSINSTNRTYTYTPVRNFRGTDTLILTVTDQYGQSGSLTVTVTVN